jgi:hypothetical protein
MRNEPNLGQSQIFVTVVLTMNYNEKSKLDTWSKQTQTKPILKIRRVLFYFGYGVESAEGVQFGRFVVGQDLQIRC